jgi:vacuolar-type H+-ATPase subunit E/Vma4
MQKSGQIETGSAALIDAIRQQADERLRAIEAQAAAEVKAMEDEHTAAAVSITRELEADARLQAARECRRIRHKAEIEAKKLRLQLLEEFISRMIESARKMLATERRQDYRMLLVRTAGTALARIPGGMAVIHMRPDDVEHEGQELLRALASEQGAAPAVQLAADIGIDWGGCIVEHAGQGVSYIATVREAVMRSSSRIRSEALKLIEEHGHSAAGREGRAWEQGS